MRMVLLGAPGSGKGTQAQRLQAKYGVPQVSSGDLLRDAVTRGTDLGLKAKAAMDAGQLVSDDVVLGLIRERLGRADAKAGFVLDGFPRNSDQANALNAMLVELGSPLEAVLLMDVRRETLIKRLAGRRICRTCGRVFNISFAPPGTPPRCDNCADHPELYQRPDDKEEVIAKRLKVYESQTRPLIEYYTKLGMLRVVQGEGELEVVFARMEAAAQAATLQKPARKTMKPAAAARRKPQAAVRTGKKAAAGKKASKPVKKAARKAARKKVAAEPPARKGTSRKARRPAVKAAGRKPVARRVAGKQAASRKKVVKRKPARKPAKKK